MMLQAACESALLAMSKLQLEFGTCEKEKSINIGKIGKNRVGQNKVMVGLGSGKKSVGLGSRWV